MNLKTRLRSTGMRHFSSPGFLAKQRAKARKLREKRGDAPTVHYFHQVDDPYSHLAVQKLDELKSRYSLAFKPHLVTQPDAAYKGSAEHFDYWAKRDAQSVACAYGTTFAPPAFSNTDQSLSSNAVAAANQELSHHLTADNFASMAFELGQSLWSNNAMDAAIDGLDSASLLEEGNALRHSLGHYQGAMFHFDGEWFWGVDRLRLLEQRLIEEGYGRTDTLCVPEPVAQNTHDLDSSGILLEYFPSLRSPYTAIGHQRVLDLISRSGVEVKVRPVMPMMMRGIPAPREKQRYIITDAGREGRAHGAPFGRIVDPFGEPVKRAFALFPGAVALGHGMEFITAYLQAAWFDGTDITTERGLKRVASNANMNLDELRKASQNIDWNAVLDDNLAEMLNANLWGVPSFRVSGGNATEPYVCWGQDRIWRVENEIAKRV